jgi:tellurite resistance protein TehA-like permease
MIFAFLLYDEIDFKETVTADDEWPQIMARVIFWIGAISHTLLTIIKMGEWVGRRLELEHVHAQWMILPVGLSIAALIAPTIPMFKVNIDSDNADIAQNMFVSRFFYSIAFLMWITLFVVTFLKTVTTHNSDNRVRHGAFIWLAAPCAIGLADLTLCLVSVQENEICQDTFANYYFIGMFMFLSLAWASLPYLAYFGRDKFGMGYWTECFALDTLAACGATFYALNGFKASRNLMFIGLVMASLANMAAFLHTISAIIRRRGVFTPEVKWGPLSFMKLTHEAFRGNLTKLQSLLSELEVSSSSPETLGLFAAHYQRFFVVHEEHAKHEDEVIFKIFNDFFKDHAKHWNADHEEDHAKMEKWRGSADRLLDTDLDEDTRKTALSILKNELPEFFIHFREHLLGEEEHLQPIGRKYIPLELQKQMSRKVFELTPADRWEIIIPYVVLNVPRHEQRIRYLKVLTWAMPERAQQIGAIVYRNVDAVMWERLRVELPDIIPRGEANWKRYY